ncbi:cytochrome C oxidase subunit III [Algoriphagus aestuariicola]|jgi:cytochrome c oxidase subunit 3|uniref:Cytochrome C oxidase subunit III n=1 Tax=Algoriphagus aestuariicola TaxID=1852016 RepID=A0ABS3BUM5_9BACT|nr:cytochrome C oxidase subunit III [Algoriphagus aestuariicola]MBN7802534.1 cytochrome C oxidase subunit III [Algoriphagus aestuariicola]
MHQTKEPKTWLQRLESLHPYEMLLFLGMLSSGLIFLFLVVAFLYTGIGQLAGMGQRMPVAFLISTFMLIISGYTASQMRLHFRNENISRLEGALRNTFMLGVIFAVLQFAGWKELNDMGISLTGLPSGSFLFVLSGIHLFHLMGALVFALIMLLQLRKAQDDGVQKLILITNPFEKMRIRLFTVYWHFMDVVWLVLFLLFVLSF